MKSDQINLQLKSLPETSGVYQFFDEEGRYLYVGKAKNLKKRVSSYFNKKHDSGKLRVLVSKVVSIKHIVVISESDALLLENNLIKTNQPRYNVLLKDDKSYPWICIKKERFPRVFYTRNLIKDGSEYYGPYSNMRVVTVLLDMIRKLYPLRTCKYDLSKENISSGKYKTCLEYHLKNCKGACEGYQEESFYMSDISSIRSIIKGDVKNCLKDLEEQMLSYVGKMEFEEAHQIKLKIDALKNYQSKSTIVNPKINNVDVFSIISDESCAYVNFLQISKGAIIRSYNLEIKKRLEETDDELLQLSIVDLRHRFNLNSKEVLLQFPVTVERGLKVILPKAGDKKQLLDLSIRNAKFYRQDKLNKIRVVDPDRHVNRILAQMKSDLRLQVEPRHIECFDNSNTQGTNPVASCVVFRNCKPSKQDYRRFNIKTVEGPDDFASMEEVVYRRYKRMLEEKQSLPQLIIIDGGKGQLSSALKSLDALGLRGKVAILGIAKRLEELFFPEDNVPLYLEKTSETLKIIQQLRNEAHRFGILFHRNKRSKNSFVSELEKIKGIGKATETLLLRHFKSLKRIKESNLETLINVVGEQKAKKIFNTFN